MSDLLDLPPIEAAALALPEPAPAQTLAELATKPLALMEPDLLALSERYRAVAFDLKTPKGLAGMKAARHDLRENGRFAVQRATAEFKSQANAAKRAVDELAERLVGIVRPREDEFTTAIDAREAEIEAEKAEKARIEAERVAKLQAGIATIRGYIQKAAGLPAYRIALGLAMLEDMKFTPEAWQEFASQAEAARTETLEALRRMHAAAVQAEADRAERERLEAAAVQLRAEVAEVQRIQAERQAAEEAREREQAAKIAEGSARAAAVLTPPPEQPHTKPLAVTPPPATHTTPNGTLADAGTGEILSTPALYRPLQDVPQVSTVDTSEAPASVHGGQDDEPAVKLGDLCARLGFTMTEAFIVARGITPRRDGRAVLVAESDLPTLADKLVERIREVLG